MSVATILWRRLDVPGHDACRLERRGSGWALEGTAVFRHGGVPARLSYAVECDGAWLGRRGRVHGWMGDRDIDRVFERTPAGWSVGGAPVAGLAPDLDLDLGFTPATNLLALRRLALGVGQSADALAAWLDFPEPGLTLLPQRYERRSSTSYAYWSPTTGYADVLEVDAEGFVTRYPGLWEAER